MCDLSPLKMGDLRTISLMREGLSIESIAYVLGTSKTQVRYRLNRIERVLGCEVYVKARFRIGSAIYLTDEGKLFGDRAIDIIRMLDDAVEGVNSLLVPS